MKHDIGIYSAINGTGYRLNIPTHRAKVSFDYAEHGMRSAKLFIPLSFTRAYNFSMDTFVYYVIISRAKGIWSGRIEDKKLVNGGVEITAYGMWNALNDVPYTRLWVDKQYNRWKVHRSSAVLASTEDRFIVDTDNRIFISPVKNAIHGNTGAITETVYVIYTPVSTDRQINACSFSYTFDAPTNWRADLYRGNAALTAFTNLWSITSAGAVLSGTQTLTFTADDRLLFDILHNAADAVHPNENGANYLKITDLRVATSTSTTIYADEIVESMLDTAYANNSQLSNAKILIQNSVQALDVENYEDASIPSIIDQLAKKSTDVLETDLFEAGVNDNYLYFRSRRYNETTGFNVWYVDVDDIEFVSTITDLYNSVYVIYQDTNNDKARTATSVNTASQGLYGVNKTKAVQFSTTNNTFAIDIADSTLVGSKKITPKINIKVKKIYYTTGGIAKVSDARNGDRVIIRNLVTNRFNPYFKLDTFRIAEVAVDLNEDSIVLTPEAPLSTVDVLLAGG